MKITKAALPLALAAAILGLGATADSQTRRVSPATAKTITPDASAPAETRMADDRPALTADGRMHLFLRMEDEPAARVFAQRNESYQRAGSMVLRGGAAEAQQLAASEAMTHARTLEQKQQGLVNRLESSEFNSTIVYRTQMATNGIAVLARPDQWEALAKLPGVKSVAVIHPKTLRVNSSVNYMGTRNFWDPTKLNGRGEGVGICIIDTGLDFVHRSFGGSGDGTPTGTGVGSYVRGATTIGGSTPQTIFPTSKVIWGWDVVGDAYNGGLASPPVSVPSPDPNPMDVNGHGTACASLAAGFGTTSANLTYPGPWDATNPDTAAATTKVSPGIAPLSALYILRVFGIAGATFVSADAVDIATAVYLWQLGPATDPLPPRLAALTGAAPIPRTPVLSILSMSLGDDAGLDYVGDPDTDSANNATAAGLSVLAAAGNAYDNYYNAGTPANATGAISVAASLNGQGTSIADAVASYSSRGPRGSDSKLKPDITSPAESVSTASVGTNNGNRSFNGTSSATPHLAGAMALLRQYRPGYTAEEYKALIMNSVRVDPRVNAAGAFYGLSRIGVGRITLNPADNFPTALAMSTDPDAPVSVSYGLVSVPVDSSQQLMKTVRVVNKENIARTFSVSFTDWATTPGATFSLPDGNSISVPANGQAILRVQLDVNGSQLRHSRDTQTSSIQGTGVARNFVSEAAGRLQFNEVGGPGHSMRLSVHSVVRPTSSLSVTPTALSMNPSQTFTFAGTGINTGANTNVLLNNPADIVSQAKGFELQYQNLTPSGTFFEQSEVKYVGITSDFALRLNPFDPTTGSANQSAVLVFAVAMHKDFAIPGELGTQVRILIDRNRTGATDIVLRNYTSNTTTNQNVYFTGTSLTNGNVADGTAVTSTTFFANITTGVANNMLNNNLALLPARVQQLGLTAATAKFNYKVQVTRHDAFGYTINSETPWLTYDVANPGLDASSGQAMNEPFVLSGQNGATVPIAFNAANFQSNASLGLLMVYPHNASGQRTQVITPLAPLALASAVSRKMQGASTYDIALPGIENRNSAGNHTIVVSFNNPVVSGAASTSGGSGSISGSPTFSGNTMTINLTGVGDAQNLIINLSNVTDSFGQTLPAGSVTLTTLLGDVNGNGSVNGTDVSQVKSQSGIPVSGSNFRADLNANGSINGTDVSIAKANSGHVAP